MKVISKVISIALLNALMLATAPGSADAGGRHRHFRGDVRGSGHHHRHHHQRGFNRRGFHHHGSHHRGFVHRPALPVFVTPSFVVAPPVLVAPPVVYAPPPIYSAPPVYVPPAPYAAAPGPYAAPPRLPRVVEFPNGRYELRGDGVYSPYTWVWIPNPPVAPPAPEAPPAPPDAPEPTRRPAGRTTMVYRWTDERGVTTWTDTLEKVPTRYRAQAGRLAP
jgi:hypothetical protein